MLRDLLPDEARPALGELSCPRSSRAKALVRGEAAAAGSDEDEELAPIHLEEKKAVPDTDEDVLLPLTFASFSDDSHQRKRELLFDCGATHNFISAQTFRGSSHPVDDTSAGYLGLQSRIRGATTLRCRLHGGFEFQECFHIVDRLPFDSIVCFRTITEYQLLLRRFPYHKPKDGSMQLNTIVLGVKSKAVKKTQTDDANKKKMENEAASKARREEERRDLAKRKAAEVKDESTDGDSDND